MYLTRMHLNPSRRETRFLLASPQRLHAAVLSSFPPGSATETPAGRVLWRVDRPTDQPPQLYIGSPSEPDLTGIVEQAGWPAAGATWQSTPMDQLLSRLDAGQQWRFRVTANPIHNVKDPEGGRGKRLAHVTVTQQEEWFVARAAGWGFDVESDHAMVTVRDRRTLSFTRRSDGTGRTVTVATATYDGILVVGDPDRMRHSLGHGLGRAKAYGCGLLTLAPLQ